ncbi:cupin domain-containing protein [Streptantibioticus rubrisoli]|uniref:Cupin domain-containing protein n=1 Tax=Streptantibioticus rubrisoli TaxID=1387313 RepID=A0ABT1PBM2_9ACTN|nr:cupin domain-containing protein [Streptantibioticus rubrisoli]MCQ4042777.1 cupin domain-containing protein [Streptantibioticus rubrisoli]
MTDEAAVEGLVDDSEEFFARYWARAAVVRTPRTPLTGLISSTEIWAEIDCGLLLPPYLRVFAPGDAAPAVAAERASGGHAPPNAAAVRHAFDHGATLQLNNVEQWHRPTRELVAALAPGLPGLLRAVAFLSPPGEAPVITAHMDGAHVFVIQVEGEKDWAVGAMSHTTLGDPAFCPTPELPPDGRLDVTLRPGEVLYVPHGCAHYALARSTESLHLSVNVEAPSTRHLLDVYLATFAASTEGRRLCAEAGPRSAELVRLVREGLAAHLAAADPEQTATEALQLFSRDGGGAPGR